MSKDWQAASAAYRSCRHEFLLIAGVPGTTLESSRTETQLALRPGQSLVLANEAPSGRPLLAWMAAASDDQRVGKYSQYLAKWFLQVVHRKVEK